MRLDAGRLTPEDITEISREIGAHNVTPVHLIALGYKLRLFQGEAWVIRPVVERLEFGVRLSEKLLGSLDVILEEIISEK